MCFSDSDLAISTQDPANNIEINMLCYACKEITVNDPVKCYNYSAGEIFTELGYNISRESIIYNFSTYKVYLCGQCYENHKQRQLGLWQCALEHGLLQDSTT